MAIIQGNAKQGSTRGFYPRVINGSLRFNDDDGAYLSWTPTSSGSQQKFTWSGWVKIGSQAASKSSIFASGGGGSNVDFYRNSSGALTFEYYNGATNYYEWTNAVYRDPSAWYHIVLAIDTTLATADNRVRLYINGDEVTSYLYNVTPAQNFNYPINTSSYTMKLGVGAQYTSGYYDGYMANVHFIDGQALTASDFGETKNGVWVAKDYAGTFGTNGFYLTFEDDTQVEAFNTVLYRGNGGTQSITGVGFQPDLVWFKSRSGTQYHALFDAVRGGETALATNATGAESTNETANAVVFDSDGMTVKQTASGSVNNSGLDIVAWCWKAGDSNVSNTDGTITSTVRANDTYGFSIIDLNTPASGSFTVGHGLSSAPDFLILKRRDAGSSNWVVGHTSMGWDKYMFLQSTAAQASSTTAWSNTAPTSSVINLDSSFYGGSANYICYCWSETTGYSKFGSYTGGTNPQTITTTFKPAFVLIKAVSGSSSPSTQNWYMFDNTRDVSGDNLAKLYPNLSNAESTAADNQIEFLDTGFTLKSTNDGTNASGNTYIYAAFADTREAAFWLDQSGNDNDWQPVNLDHNDTVADSPTNNFATFNPIEAVSGGTRVLSDGNLSAAVTYGGNYPTARLTFLPTNVTGQFYWEVTIGSKTSTYYQLGFNIKSLVYSSGDLHTTYRSDGNLSNTLSGSWSGTGVSYTQGDVIGVAYDASNGEAKFYKNGTYVATWTPSSFPEGYNFGVFSSSATNNYTINCGQQPFKYDPPA